MDLFFDVKTHKDVLGLLLDICQSMSDDLRASLSSCQDLTASLSKISSLVDGGEDVRKLAKEYKGALATLKTAQKCHLAVATLAERQMNIIRHHFVLPTKYRDAFESLSAEVLLRVIKFLPPLERPRLALLNRRFRDLVYSTPSMWAYISTASMTKPQIARHATMSQPLQLDVDAHAVRKDRAINWKELGERWKLTASLESRWDSVSFDNHMLEGFQKEAFIGPVSDVSSVRTLVLRGAYNPFGEEGDDSRFLATFVNTWRFPKLSKLVIRGNIPPPGSFTSIDTLVIDLAEPFMSNQAEVRLFLNNLRSLRHLEVQMECTSLIIPDDPYWSPSDIDIELLNVRSFRFSVFMADPLRTERKRKDTDCKRDYERVVINVMSSLSMPNVEKIDLGFFGLKPGPPEVVFHGVENYLPINRSLEKLRRLHLRIDPLPREVPDFDLLETLGQFQRRFPSLEVFTVYHPIGAIEETLFTGAKHPSGPSSELFQLQMAITDYANLTWPNDKTELSKSTGRCRSIGDDSSLLGGARRPEVIFCPL